MKLSTALTTSSAPTTARSEYFPSTADRTMISSSIHADMPQNLPKELEDRVALFFGHFVVAVLLPAGVHLRVREPGLGVDMERRERVGNRRGGDVRAPSPLPASTTAPSTTDFFTTGCMVTILYRPTGTPPP